MFGAGRARLGHRDHIDLAGDSRMQNVVSLQPDRPRPQRALGVPRSGARILFFTGVRYCRDEGSGEAGRDEAGPLDRPEDGCGLSRLPAPGRALDAVAH